MVPIVSPKKRDRKHERRGGSRITMIELYLQGMFSRERLENGRCAMSMEGG